MVIYYTVIESCKRKVASGEISLRDAAIKLCECGWFPYIPSDEQTRQYLDSVELTDGYIPNWDD